MKIVEPNGEACPAADAALRMLDRMEGFYREFPEEVRQVPAGDLLREFFSHCEEHPNGWGMAAFGHGCVSIEKEPVKASKSACLRERAASAHRADRCGAPLFLENKPYCNQTVIAFFQKKTYNHFIRLIVPGTAARRFRHFLRRCAERGINRNKSRHTFCRLPKEKSLLFLRFPV